MNSVDNILELKNISYYNLKNTGIPLSEKLKVVKFNTEMEVKLGEKANLIINGDFFDTNEELLIEKVNGDAIGEIKNYTILAEKFGEESIQLSCGEFSQIINIKVVGIDANQEVGEVSDSTITDQNKNTILDSNGELWQVYPETKKIGKDIKRYIGGWIYIGKEPTEYEYQLHNDDTLWSGDTKLAENVKEFLGHYALDNNGNLIDIYNTNSVAITDIESWVETWRFDMPELTSWCLALKKDGTLWKRMEVEKNAPVNEFEKIAENVKAINQKGYLSNDGKYISFLGGEEIDRVESIPVYFDNGGQYYIGKDGSTYWYVSGKWINMGEIKLVDGCTTGMDSYCLTESGEIYKMNYTMPSYEKLIDHAKKITRIYLQNGIWKVLYQGDDGLWRSVDEKNVGTKENPIAFAAAYRNSDMYFLEDYGVVNDYNVTKNGVLILNHVREIISTTDRITVQIFAIRTDGTLWNINGVPEMVLNLNSSAVLKGDVNEDGEVNEQDVQLILRYVCGKEELNTDQQNLADVDTDGVVDIQDLRKILRYVRGKTIEL